MRFGGVGRFIPARAGNTVSYMTLRSLQSVHPRAGGEHLNAVVPLLHQFGSSPRGRGTHQQRRLARHVDRFIPARAGNTLPKLTGGWTLAVHPRAGGEHWCDSAIWRAATGSSPRGRGTHQDGVQRHPDRRFIPARAGGTHRLGDRPVGRGRFIPARAGNTMFP